MAYMYRNGIGKYQEVYDELCEKMKSEPRNPKWDPLRNMNVLYWDLHINGGGNIRDCHMSEVRALNDWVSEIDVETLGLDRDAKSMYHSCLHWLSNILGYEEEKDREARNRFYSRMYRRQQRELYGEEFELYEDESEEPEDEPEDDDPAREIHYGLDTLFDVVIMQFKES